MDKQARRVLFAAVSAAVVFICIEWILKNACVPSSIVPVPDWWCGLLRFMLYAEIVFATLGLLVLVVGAATRKT